MASESPACGICHSIHISKPSTAWCFECNKGLCEECKEHHILKKASKSHGFIPVNEFQKLPVSVLQIEESCKSHSERYQAYCHKHECSCCSKCLIGDHKNCKDLTDINDVVCRIKSSNMMLEIEKSMRELTDNLQRIKQKRAGNLSSLKLHRQTIEKEIQIARHTVNEHFDRLERKLLKELQIIEHDERKKISKILASVERKEKEIDEFQISLAIIKQHASDLQTFLISKQIEHELTDTESLIQSIQNSNELSDVIISFQTNDLMKSLENISKFGKIVVQTSQSDISLVRQKIKQAQAKVDIVTECNPDHQYETIKNEEDSCFIVTVKPAHDALKFGLNGQYRLCITPSGFILEDIEKKTTKCCWAFKIVRKFGKRGIKNEFEITVGRRNVLGEGTVVLLCSSKDEPDQISRIAQTIMEGMKSKVKH
ncbi:transcription intermediary factor 1-beta-like [Mytilus californianus]|uniref:transcription intermediary factor 1-beta-like n=1 Tax=Mytilus californianus TaxID=6549 RepID=UPI002245294A|nr:transcription intermediary factor 1-beta-like [Mytilus californianus]XP_052067025.1 transcription intermediary factor 1-beta-like [Mytilus californianus]